MTAVRSIRAGVLWGVVASCRGTPVRMPLIPLLLVALTPALTGFTTYDTLSEWQAVVGAHELEDFEDVPDQEIPAEGGSIQLDGFTIVADGNHGSDGDICSGLCAPKVEDGVFLGDIHGNSDSSLNFVDFVFDAPISAFAMDIGDVEACDIGVVFGGSSTFLFFDEDETKFLGVVLDEPITSLSFSLAGFSFFTVDNVRWSPLIPEPTAALLFGTGFAVVGLASRRRPAS